MKTWQKVAVGVGVYLVPGVAVAAWSKRQYPGNGVADLAMVAAIWPVAAFNLYRNAQRSTARAPGVQAATADGANRINPTATRAQGGGFRIVEVPGASGGVDRVDVAGPLGFANLAGQR